MDVERRPLGTFIDDVSTWYVRRSRDRFKTEGEDKQQALATLSFVLYTTAQVMAPTMPFFAEDLYQKVKADDDVESVHLTSWPTVMNIDQQLLKDMDVARVVASASLREREKINTKIRQPLATLYVSVGDSVSVVENVEIKVVVADEANVKDIIPRENLQTGEVELDTKISAELKEEGTLRDLMRRVQEWRKEQKLTIADRPTLALADIAPNEEEQRVAKIYRAKIVTETGLKDLTI